MSNSGSNPQQLGDDLAERLLQEFGAVPDTSPTTPTGGSAQSPRDGSSGGRSGSSSARYGGQTQDQGPTTAVAGAGSGSNIHQPFLAGVIRGAIKDVLRKS